MKKLGRILVVMMMVSVLVLTGCQGDIDKSELIGRYECETINGNPPEATITCYLEVIDEETYTLVYNGHDFAIDLPGNYRVKGDKLFLDGFYDGKGNPAEQECVVEDNTIKYTELQTEFKYVFKK